MGGLGLTAEYLGNNTARYTAQPNLTDNNFTNFAKKNADVTTYATELLSYVEGDYVMVPNNYFYPSGGTYTAVDGSKTLVFK
jgi:F0F1-type ATP synthase beta subunit